MNKEQVLEKFFNNEISPKFLHKFKQKTPNGNIVSGWISKQRGKYLSSMVLTEIQTPTDVIRCNRFIRGMPKQHYYDEEDWSLQKNHDFTLYFCDEKLDGTCLILYALYDNEDNLIEIVPRTRGMAVASNHVLSLYNLIDKAQIENFFSYPHNYDYCLFFELYGILNRHEITDYRHYIDIKLIGASFENEILHRNELKGIAYNYHFGVPDQLFSIYYYRNEWKIKPEISRLYPYYSGNISFENKYSSLGDCINALSDIIEDINNNYKKKNKHIAIEGVVINGKNNDGDQRYIKIKPPSVFERAKLGNGIPSFAIRKEVFKYFDEYGVVKVKEIYNIDQLHFLQFVVDNLKEEFPEDIVESKKTEKKINNIFFDIWENKTPDLTIQKIAQNLADEYPKEEIGNIMRIFAKEYPEFKNKSGQIYSVLTHLVKNGD